VIPTSKGRGREGREKEGRGGRRRGQRGKEGDWIGKEGKKTPLNVGWLRAWRIQEYYLKQ